MIYFKETITLIYLKETLTLKRLFKIIICGKMNQITLLNYLYFSKVHIKL